MVSRSRLHRFAGDPGTRVEGQKARRTGERHRKLLLLAVHIMYEVLDTLSRSRLPTLFTRTCHARRWPVPSSRSYPDP